MHQIKNEEESNSYRKRMISDQKGNRKVYLIY
jgi:hypothetical protein